MSSSSYCGMQNENSRNMGFYEKGFLGVIFRFALLVASYYLNINWQKNPIHLKIIWFLLEVFYGVLLLPLMCAVKATRSCVDFVLLELFPRVKVVFELPKLFACLNIVLELLQDRK